MPAGYPGHQGHHCAAATMEEGDEKLSEYELERLRRIKVWGTYFTLVESDSERLGLLK